jgi:serine/threonine protein kinase
VVRLYDDFDVCGPNGKHEVFVIEVTGPRLEMMLMCVYDAKTGSLLETLCRRWAQQLLLALGYLSTEGIVHSGKALFCPRLFYFAACSLSF